MTYNLWNFSRDLVSFNDNAFPPFKFLSRCIQSDMCVRSIKRPDAIQIALRAIVSGGFSYPLKSRTCPNIGSAWASLVIQHYSRGTIQINLKVRNPDYGGSMAASYITVVSGRKAVVYIYLYREECSLRFRKKRKDRARDLFIDSIRPPAILYRICDETSAFYIPFGSILISSIV